MKVSAGIESVSSGKESLFATVSNIDGAADFLAALSMHFDLHLYKTNQSAFDAVQESPPGLILLDFDFQQHQSMQHLKAWLADERIKNTPIVFYSRTSCLDQKLVAFDAGAQDFISIPVSARLAVASLKARIRYSKQAQEKTFEIAEKFRVDLDAKTVWILGREQEVKADFSPKQFLIFALLAHNFGRVLSRKFIKDAVWGSERVKLRTLDSYVAGIRKALGERGNHLCSTRGGGYSLK